MRRPQDEALTHAARDEGHAIPGEWQYIYIGFRASVASLLVQPDLRLSDCPLPQGDPVDRRFEFVCDFLRERSR